MRLKIILFFLLLLAITRSAFALDYPSKPIRLIDPYATGGSTSVVSMILSQKFEALTKQPMVVEHRPGAGSNIGSDIVARAKPDGYTLLIGSSSLAINPHLYSNMPFDPLKDLSPIAILTLTPNVLAVHPSLPVTTVSELISYAREHPGKLNYGSSGNGATNHMAMELLKAKAHIDIIHVPFKGGGEAMAALLGNHVQLMFNPASTLAPQAKSAKLRMIAVGARKRVPNLDLPTIAESGVPGFESNVWFGLFAPSGTPAPIIEALNIDINKILKDDTVRATLNDAGLTPIGGTPDQLRDLLTKDFKTWGALVQEIGVKIK